MRRSLVPFLVLALPIPALLACSSADPSTTREATSAAPSAAAVVHLSARPGESTPLSLQVAPDAECTIRDVTPPPDLVANARGVLRFVAQVPAEGAQLALDCTRADGTVDAYALDVAAARADDARVTTNVDESTLAPGIARPPLTEDPMLLADEELVARGFPPPPNRDPSSAAYAHWLSRARAPAIRMTPHARHAREHAPRTAPAGHSFLTKGLKPQSVTNTTDPHWSGYIAEPNDATWEVTGSWDIPSIKATGLSSMGQWVGIGGWYDGDEGLIQAGTAGQTGIGFRGTIIASYNAFYEYFISYTTTFPVYLHSDPSWPGSLSNTEWVSPVGIDDSYEVTVWAGDSHGNFALGAGYGWYFIDAHPNPTASNPYPAAEVYIGSLPTPAGAPPSQGWSAEWIVERASVNQLPDFGSTQITGATAYGPGGYSQTPGDSNPAQLCAITGSAGNLDSANTESGGVGFTWLRPD